MADPNQVAIPSRCAALWGQSGFLFFGDSLFACVASDLITGIVLGRAAKPFVVLALVVKVFDASLLALKVFLLAVRWSKSMLVLLVTYGVHIPLVSVDASNVVCIPLIKVVATYCSHPIGRS